MTYGKTLKKINKTLQMPCVIKKYHYNTTTDRIKIRAISHDNKKRKSVEIKKIIMITVN